MSDVHTAYYGNVRMDRIYCGECDCYTFILDDKKYCCDNPIETESQKPYKVIIPPRVKRKTPTHIEKKDILNAQKGKCFYCGHGFGTVVWDNKKQKARILKINWDHFTPFAYGFNNKSTNFVASCNICNSLKSSKVFNTVEEARKYIIHRWAEKEMTS